GWSPGPAGWASVHSIFRAEVSEGAVKPTLEQRWLLRQARHLALATPWFGQFYALTPLYTILLQVQVIETVSRDFQGRAVGLATGIGGIFALALPPLVGYWSDGISSRFGRRRPFLVAGSAGMVGSCLILLSAHSYPPLLIGFVAFVA